MSSPPDRRPPRVHVSGRVPDAILHALQEHFELAPEPDGVDGILALLGTTVDEPYLDRAGPDLRVVANYAVGVNNIDLDAARARSVLVANTPDVLTRATAELGVGLMLSLLRRVTEGDRLIRGATPWEFSLEFMLGESLDAKTFASSAPGGSAARRPASSRRSARTRSSPGGADPLEPLLARGRRRQPPLPADRPRHTI